MNITESLEASTQHQVQCVRSVTDGNGPIRVAAHRLFIEMRDLLDPTSPHFSAEDVRRVRRILIAITAVPEASK